MSNAFNKNSKIKGVILRFNNGKEHKVIRKIKDKILVPTLQMALGSASVLQVEFSNTGIIENGWKIYKPVEKIEE